MQVKNVKGYNTNFCSIVKLSNRDIAYKKLLQQGLKDTFQLDCKIEHLNSIAGPDELNDIIAKLRPQHYIVGDNYRANFHIHTKASDGDLTPITFLEQCKQWADYIFKSKKSLDNIPPFSASITDHDRVKNVKEVIALISQNPDKYKNFKFVSGCEFLFNGYEPPYSAFEAVGLGFNPFDKSLEPLMKGFSSKNSVDDIKKVTDAGGILSLAHPLIFPERLNDDFFSFIKHYGINGVEGNYQYLNFDKEYINSVKDLLLPLIKRFKMFVTGGTDTHGNSIFDR